MDNFTMFVQLYFASCIYMQHWSVQLIGTMGGRISGIKPATHEINGKLNLNP